MEGNQAGERLLAEIEWYDENFCIFKKKFRYENKCDIEGDKPIIWSAPETGK